MICNINSTRGHTGSLLVITKADGLPVITTPMAIQGDKQFWS